LYNINILAFTVFSIDPLSRFPQGGKALFCAPSPMGEGWEGGLITYEIISLLFIPDTQYNNKLKNDVAF
jgi:hypothetical protein